jgi:hypothetical protein
MLVVPETSVKVEQDILCYSPDSHIRSKRSISGVIRSLYWYISLVEIKLREEGFEFWLTRALDDEIIQLQVGG